MLDNFTTGNPSDLDGMDVRIIQGDILDYDAVSSAGRDAEAVVHLAAHTRVLESVENPMLNFETNGKGTLNVLESCRRNNVPKVVFASTGGAIIGDVMPPVTEDMLPRPLSPYGASKLMGEGYCSAYAGSYGLSIRSVRFSNVYGPYSYHKGSVVAQFFRRILLGEGIEIFGDGSQTRDFIYVGDVCAGIRSVLHAPSQAGFDVYNLATESETSINQLVELIQQTVGTKFDVNYSPPNQGEIYRNFASVQKAQRELDFRPRVPLGDGLELTWRWFKRHFQDHKSV